jgi:hypothetical protein
MTQLFKIDGGKLIKPIFDSPRWNWGDFGG